MPGCLPWLLNKARPWAETRRGSSEIAATRKLCSTCFSSRVLVVTPSPRLSNVVTWPMRFPQGPEDWRKGQRAQVLRALGRERNPATPLVQLDEQHWRGERRQPATGSARLLLFSLPTTLTPPRNKKQRTTHNSESTQRQRERKEKKQPCPPSQSPSLLAPSTASSPRREKRPPRSRPGCMARRRRARRRPEGAPARGELRRPTRCAR